ncbi:tetraspanin family protein [Ancylostoma caninum]|uniref:Tetraspanin family protein n=1 Tax=Ancylostoma caninum TaxID=29170 RepID=A0A368F984_ANCCA|nr:tetraspanin family protein [Ancylostoma caninum]
MTIQRTGGDGAKIALMIYTVLFWASGLALIFIGLWMLLDPKRNYILDLVDFSEDDPLLTFAAYIAIVAGVTSLFVGFIGCCGAVQRMRCLLVGFMICLFVLFLADVSIGTLALVYRNKFTNGQLTIYVKNLTQNRYNRDKWVQPLLDTVQFYLSSPESGFEENLRNLIKFSYGVSMEIEESRRITVLIDKLQFHEECCGATTGDDYLASRWMALVSTDPIYENDDPPLVPLSCCRQILGASALNPVARSLARCQQSNPNRMWRHVAQQCCGGESPRDYFNSFWFITNTYRGTRSFVPPSCCRQSQAGRAWAPVPIDPMCTTYRYDSQAFESSVYNVGCHEKLMLWLDEQTWIFAGVGFGFAALMVGFLLDSCETLCDTL